MDDLVIYNNLKADTTASAIFELIESCAQSEFGEDKRARMRSRALRMVGDLAAHACICGFSGNIWQSFLIEKIVTDENTFSLSCEKRRGGPGSLRDLALRDIAILKDYFFVDFDMLSKILKCPELKVVSDFKLSDTPTRFFGYKYSARIRARMDDLRSEIIRVSMLPGASMGNAGNPAADKILSLLEDFYARTGTGLFGLHRAFRLDDGYIVAIENLSAPTLNDLVGLEIAKKQLTDNTEAFVSGRPANNCLLYGDAGTGKSTAVRAIANDYFDRGLRVIELYRHQYDSISSVIEQLRRRNYYFILLLDDLSFEEDETDYKYLKAVIEGGVSELPANVLIYATSNRRHLIRENYSDKEDEDMHTGDTVQEKLSLSMRFGVTIYFGRPDQEEYREIVKALAERSDIGIPDQDLYAEARKWELYHGGRSGRTAEQFVDHLAGNLEEKINKYK